ncbi:MAG: hypothetical protein KGL43_24765 [Burkholderiales bacterium]|nr:hypothetical protein [Burkholderiales bacterium]MDE2395446.1 hypothetical protein [Burkholderiales bacterium]MDE2456814.1 hypothetical protein [Burkholderiales bacterium]
MSRAPEHPASLLATKRQLLVAQSRLQRLTLRAQWHALQRPPAWMAPVQRAAELAREKPWLVVLPVAAALVARPRWIWRLGAAAIASYRAWRFARRWV